eukprot:7381987-Prymnesium_polylepis.1
MVCVLLTLRLKLLEPLGHPYDHFELLRLVTLRSLQRCSRPLGGLPALELGSLCRLERVNLARALLRAGRVGSLSGLRGGGQWQLHRGAEQRLDLFLRPLQQLAATWIGCREAARGLLRVPSELGLLGLNLARLVLDLEAQSVRVVALEKCGAAHQ